MIEEDAARTAPVGAAAHGGGARVRPVVVSRRRLLGGASAAVAGATLGAPLLAPVPAALAQGTGDIAAPATVAGNARLLRQERAYRVRMKAAARMRSVPLPGIPAMGDEARYPNRIGSFSKGLPHDPLGEVNPYAYEALLNALASGRAADFEDVPMGARRSCAIPSAASPST